MIEPPRRTVSPHGVRCYCIIYYEGDQVTPNHRCSGSTSGPDDPFCAYCTDRHPGANHVVTEWTPEWDRVWGVSS